MFAPYIWWGIGLTIIAGLIHLAAWYMDRLLDRPLTDADLYCSLVDWQLDQVDDDALREHALVEWLEQEDLEHEFVTDIEAWLRARSEYEREQS